MAIGLWSATTRLYGFTRVIWSPWALSLKWACIPVGRSWFKAFQIWILGWIQELSLSGHHLLQEAS